jgi:hypothetical protein
MSEYIAVSYFTLIFVIAFWKAWDNIKKNQKLNEEAQRLNANPKADAKDIIADRLNQGYPL